MKISRFPADISWYARIDLNSHEWPPVSLLDDDSWLERPIRQWVVEFCEPGTFFGRTGWILFLKEEDAVAFQLAWEQK